MEEFELVITRLKNMCTLLEYKVVLFRKTVGVIVV